jgi:hypothetical protein
MNFCGDNMMALSVGHLVGQGAMAMVAQPEEAPAAGITHFLWLDKSNYHMVYPHGSHD